MDSTPRMEGAPALRLEQVSSRRGAEESLAIDDISLTVPRGQWVCVAGANGSGKSTLVRLINGLQPCCSGIITVGGRVLGPDTLWDIRCQVGMVFPQPDDQFVGLTVADDLAFGLENQCLPPAEIHRRIWQAATQLDISHLLDRHPGTLSGGQKQRVALAAIVAINPEILILDEATSMLDAASRAELLGWLRRIRRAGRHTIITVTHDIEEMAAADRLIVLQDGRIVADGPPAELLRDEALLREQCLETPYALALCRELQALGWPIEESMTEQEAVNAIWTYYSNMSRTDTRMEQAL